MSLFHKTLYLKDLKKSKIINNIFSTLIPKSFGENISVQIFFFFLPIKTVNRGYMRQFLKSKTLTEAILHITYKASYALKKTP